MMIGRVGNFGGEKVRSNAGDLGEGVVIEKVKSARIGKWTRDRCGITSLVSFKLAIAWHASNGHLSNGSYLHRIFQRGKRPKSSNACVAS